MTDRTAPTPTASLRFSNIDGTLTNADEPQHRMTKMPGPDGFSFQCECGWGVDGQKSNAAAVEHIDEVLYTKWVRTQARYLIDLRRTRSDRLVKKAHGYLALLDDPTLGRYDRIQTTRRHGERNSRDAITHLSKLLDPASGSTLYDVLYALRSCEDAFELAAARYIGAGIAALIRGHETECYEQVRKTVFSKVLQGARSPSQSTSPLANLMERHELAAWSKWAEDLQYIDEAAARAEEELATFTANLTPSQLGAIEAAAEEMRAEVEAEEAKYAKQSAEAGWL